MPDKPERVVKVFEERYRTKKKHVRAFEPLEALFLRVETRDHTRSIAQISAKAAQRDDISHAALADGFHDGLALPNGRRMLGMWTGAKWWSMEGEIHPVRWELEERRKKTDKLRKAIP